MTPDFDVRDGSNEQIHNNKKKNYIYLSKKQSFVFGPEVDYFFTTDVTLFAIFLNLKSNFNFMEINFFLFYSPSKFSYLWEQKYTTKHGIVINGSKI